MATITRVQHEGAAFATSFPSGAALDWSFVAASAWLLIGLHLDGWAHAHRPGLETFFTPWHAILYSGFGVMALLTLRTWLVNGRAMPAGYEMTLWGVGVFFVGGIGDMLWHTFFGIEVNIEALLSPTHLLLATGFALMVAGPLRAAKRATVPALLSAGLLMAVFTFFTQFIQPGGRAWALLGNKPAEATFPVASVTPDFPVFPGGVPTRELAAMLGIGGILLFTTILLGFSFYLLRRFDLPFGSFALILSVDGALLSLMRDTIWWLGVAVVAGLLLDALVLALQPRMGGWRLRAFAAAAPGALWIVYFATLALVGGIWWSVHLWAGAAAIAALGGVALSFVAAPR